MLDVLKLARPLCVRGQQCKSGDCQTGAVAGPFTATQVAEHSSANPFAVCTSSDCTAARSWATGIEGINAQQNIGTKCQFFDQDFDVDANIAVGPTVTGKNAQFWSG